MTILLLASWLIFAALSIAFHARGQELRALRADRDRLAAEAAALRRLFSDDES